jgi:hypothetical protein
MSSSIPAGLGRIFISYRREETAYPAGWLFDRLVAHFGKGQIFKDIDSIGPGDNFAKVIRSAVESCDVLLVLIGDRWLTIAGDDGRRRLDDPEDFVRLEIKAALARDILVIPVLAGKAQMPRAAELPDDLAELAGRQALELGPARFDADMSRLLRALDQALQDTTAPRAPKAGDIEPVPPPSGLAGPAALPSSLRGSLELPKNGDQVGRRIKVQGNVTGWRHDYRLWIVHRREPQGPFWPKYREIQPDDRGNFSLPVSEGGPSGRIIISLLAVPVSRSRDFEKWLHNGAVTNHYPGIHPTNADSELASVTVLYNSEA